MQVFIITSNLLYEILECPWTRHYQSVVGTLSINNASGSGVILDLGSANERRLYNIISYLIGWAHALNDSRWLCNVAKWWTVVTGGINRTNMCVFSQTLLCNLIWQSDHTQHVTIDFSTRIDSTGAKNINNIKFNGSLTPKAESCHDANFVITGDTVCCHNGNLHCRRGRQSCHCDKFRF